MNIEEILNKLNENKKIVLVIGFLAVFGIGFLAGDAYRVHMVKTAVAEAFLGTSDTSALDSGKTDENIKLENINAELKGVYSQYSSIEITATATPTTNIVYSSLAFEVFDVNNKVIDNGYMAGMNNPQKDTKYDITGSIYTDKFTFDDIKKIEFSIGSGKTRKVLATWNKP